MFSIEIWDSMGQGGSLKKLMKTFNNEHEVFNESSQLKLNFY